MSIIPLPPSIFMCHLLILSRLLKIRQILFHKNSSFHYKIKVFRWSFARNSFASKWFACSLFCVFLHKLYKITKNRQYFFFMFPESKISFLLKDTFITEKSFTNLPENANLYFGFFNRQYPIIQIQ